MKEVDVYKVNDDDDLAFFLLINCTGMSHENVKEKSKPNEHRLERYRKFQVED